MELPDLYFRRKRLAEQTGADVYQYEIFSAKLRTQTQLLIESVDLLFRTHSRSQVIYSFVVPIMRMELGVTSLHVGRDMKIEFDAWLRQEVNIDYCLSAIELCYRRAVWLSQERASTVQTRDVQRRFEELNARMKEDGFGYALEAGLIIKVSSTYAHQEMIVPAMGALLAPKFAEANKEFRLAHEAFRDGKYEPCLTESCKAFESVLKVIAHEKNWGVDPNATLKALVTAAYNNDLIPPYMQTEFSGLRQILENGIGTIRNKNSAHGSGNVARKIEPHLASFQLHQTAAAILFLVEAAGL